VGRISYHRIGRVSNLLGGAMKTFLIVGGLIILILAVLDIMGTEVQFPTQNNYVNAGIGGVMLASPFLFGSHLSK